MLEISASAIDKYLAENPLPPISFDSLIEPRSATTLLDLTGGRINRAEVRKRAGEAMLLDLPAHPTCKNFAKEWVIVGGGPSINQCVDRIRKLKARGANVVSVNKSHDWLIEHGISPWGHVLLDPKDWVAGYVKRPRKGVRYFIASQCHPDTFESLKGFETYLWHGGQDFPEGSEPGTYLRTNWPRKPWYIVPGPTTVSMRVPFLANFLGPVKPTKFHFFGLDSSRSSGKMHGYEKPEAPDAHAGSVKATYRGKSYIFDTNSHMTRQWADFQKLVGELPDQIKAGHLPKGVDFTFYGSGLLPFYAATLGWHADPECNKDPAKVGGYTTVIAPPSPEILYGMKPISLSAA